ncbi:MAG: leucine-rich repeat domain-containing protein, partial [Muribaculaceae bacterium]|nr:leucine-rich repeat domain-containing protein [Muribaculaceae bacterium]
AMDEAMVGKVEFENWSNWYYNTEVDCLGAVPYSGGATIEAGGFTISTMEYPSDMTEIPDYKNYGLKFEGELWLPSTLKRIGKDAFSGQRDLFYIEFPEGLEEIADNAFVGCEALTFDGFPESLKLIGNCAFQGCTAQKSIILPENLTNLGNGAFSGMTGLEKAVLFSQVDAIPDYLCQGCTNLSTLYLPKNIKSIGAGSFSRVEKLEEVILPEGLEIIGFYAFAGADYTNLSNGGVLAKINFPSSLKSIRDYAFEAQQIRHIDLNEGLDSIGEYAFYGVETLKSVSFPSTLKAIGKGAFSGTSVAKTNIPASVTSIGFYSLTGEEIILGDGITSVPENALGTPAILKVGKNVKTFAYNALSFSNLRVLEMLSKTAPTVNAAFDLTGVDVDNITFLVPDGSKDSYKRNPRWAVFNIVEESEADITVYVNGSPITEEARLQTGIHPSQIVRMTVTGTLADADWRLIRENFASLTYLDLSAITNTEIPDNALKEMNQLTTLILPSKITKIGMEAFRGNSLMDMPSIPETVEDIGANAFYYCKMLTISKLPDALKMMYDGVFQSCASLRSITAGPMLVRLGNSTFEDCAGLEYVDLGDTQVKSIGYEAFSHCPSLTSIILPSELEEIAIGAFQSSALESIQLPSTLKTIGSSAFAGTKLRTVTIPNGVAVIPEDLFQNCTNLVSVNFPGSVTSIGANLFLGTEKVTGISSLAVEAPAAATDALSALSIRRCGLSIPQQSYKSYLNAAQWGRLANMTNRLVVEMPEENFNVTAIDEVEYIDISSQEKWQQEAEEAAEGEEPAAVQARRAAKASLTSGDAYTQLFNDAQFATPTTETGTRIFINPINGATLKSVFLGDEDVTSQMEGNSLLLPVKAVGTIRIVADLTGSGIEEVAVDDAIAFDTVITAFDTMGREVFAGRRADLDAAVAPGLYIIKSATTTEKVLVK